MIRIRKGQRLETMPDLVADDDAPLSEPPLDEIE
jgi:hypothetical protein